MRLWKPKARRPVATRANRLFASKLSARDLNIARLGLALAGSVLVQSVALADNPGAQTGKGAAWQQFRQTNPDLNGRELNQLFKVHWSNANPNTVKSVAQPIFDGNSITQSQLSSQVNGNYANQARTEARAAEQALRLQQSANERAQKLELKATQNVLKQQMRDSPRNFNNTVQQISQDRFVNVNGGLSLDLGSAVETITLGDKLFQQGSSITITVGGESKTLAAGSKVTAAEYIAAKQVIATGGQKLGLDGSGRAVSGAIDLSELTAGNKTTKVDDLIIPTNVLASGDFGKHGDVRITGALVNSGSIQAYSSNKTSSSATISADNITNNANATISSELNQSSRDLGGVVADLGLNLRADDTLSNYGSITSAGDLTLSAGNALTNSGQSSAHNNVNLQAPSIVNSGRFESIAANVNIDSSSVSALNVNNTGGTIAALNGAINVRTPEFDAPFNTTVTGGDLLSRELNVYTGGGTADVKVNQLTGVVNTSGSAAHVSAETADLVIGKQCLIGDPTYYNTGNIILDGDIVVGESLAIIAGGNITATSNLSEITARDAAGQGYSIYIVAGVKIISGSGEVPPGGGPATLPGQSPGSYSGNATGNVTISFNGSPGGDIDFSNASPTLTINANSTSGDRAGGDVILAAENQNAFGGNLTLPTLSTINAGGSGTGLNGDVRVVAAHSIVVGDIYNDSGRFDGSNGTITVSAASAGTTGGADLTFDVTGRNITGDFLAGTGGWFGSVSTGDIHSTWSINVLGSKTLTAGDLVTNGLIAVDNSLHSGSGDLTVGNLTSHQAAVTVKSNGAISTQNVEAFGEVKLTNVFSPSTPGVTAGNLVSHNNKVTVITKGNTSVGNVSAYDDVNLNADFGSSSTFQGGNVISTTGDVTIGGGTQVSVGDISAQGSIAVRNIAIGALTVGDMTSATNAVGVSSEGALTAGTVEAATSILLRSFHGFNVSAGNLTAHGGSINAGGSGGTQLGDLSATGFVNVGGGNGQAITVGEVTSGGYFKVGGPGSALTVGNVVAASTVDLNGFSSISIGTIQSSAAAYVLIHATNSVSVGGINAPSGPISVASNGTLYLGGSIYTGGHDLTLVANSSIDSAQGIELSTENQNGAGGLITIAAGANFQIDTGNKWVRINSGLPFGGNINFGGVTKLSSTGTTNGGDVLIVAWGGPTAGNVDLSGVPVITTGGGTVNGQNGSFRAIVGGRLGYAIDIQSIDTRSQVPGLVGIGGDVLLTVSDPQMSGPLIMKYDTGGRFGTIDPHPFNSANGDIRTGSIHSTGNIDIVTRDILTVRNSSQFVSYAPNDPNKKITVYVGHINTLGGLFDVQCFDAPNTGGSISVRSWQGPFNTPQFRAVAGKDVFISASGGINTSNFTVQSLGTATVSNINASSSSASPGGTVLITGKGAVTVGDIAVDGGTTSNGGSVTISTTSMSPTDLITVGTITARGGASGGNGGTISVTREGTGGIKFRADSLVSASAVAGNGGDITVRSGNGFISNFGKVTFLGNQTISATGAAGFQSGGIILTGASADIGGDFTIDTYGVGSLAGSKNVSFTLYAGAVRTQGHDLLVASRNNLNWSTFDLIETSGGSVGGGDVTIKSGGSFTAPPLQINASSSNDTFSGGSVVLHSGSGSGGFYRITSNGKTSGNGGTVTITGATGFNEINTDGGSSGNGGDITINLASSAGFRPDLLRSTGVVNGDITFTNSGSGYIAPYTVIGRNIVLSATDIFSSDTVPTIITGTSSVQMSAVRLILMSGVITTPLLTVSGEARHQIGVGIKFTNGSSPVTLNFSGSSGLFESIGSGTVNLGNVSGGAFELISAGDVVTTSDVNLSSSLEIVTNRLTNEHVLNGGGSITIQSVAGSGLILDGGAGGTLSAATGPINIIASAGDLILQGRTTYATTANLLAEGPSQQIHLAPGSESIANVTSFLYTSNLTGSGTLTTYNVPNATWIFLQSGTLLNNPGNIFLSGNINLAGADFAILARGNITLTGSINLAGSAGGGNLTMIAGYDFSYNSGGQVVFDKTTTINTFTPSGSAGSINATGANIITSGASGNGGNVVAVATGSITLGDITSTGGASADGGSVLVIAKNGMTVGAIDTTGGLTSGNVTLAVGNANIPTGSNFEILNGGIVGGSQPITLGTTTGGSLNAQTITATGASVILSGANAYDDRIQAGVVTADSLTVLTNSGRAQINASINNLNIAASGTSVVAVGNDKSLSLGTITGALQEVSVGVNNGGTLSNSNSIAVSKISLRSDVFDLNGGSIVTTDSANIYTSGLLSNLGTISGPIVNLSQDATINNSVLGSSVINAPTINLICALGDIGSSSNRFLLPTLNGQLFLTANNGSIYIASNTNTPAGVNLYGGSSRGVFDYLGAGTTNVVGNITTIDGDINIVTSVNKINVASGVQLNAHGVTSGNGDIKLQVLDQSKNSKKTSIITLSSGSQLNTVATGTDGVITLSVGAVSAPVLGKAPKKNVQIINQGGTIFWGKKASAFNAPTNVLHTKGANIVFNNPIGNKNIILSGATIYADPPVAEGTPESIITTPMSKATALDSFASDAIASARTLSHNLLRTTSLPVLQSNEALSLQDFAANNGMFLASNSLPLATESNSALREKGLRQLVFNNADSDNSYMVGACEFTGAMMAGICTDADLGFNAARDVPRIQHSERVKLGDGNVLFAPTRDTQIETPQGSIRIGANAIALVSVSDAGLAVFDLDDQHKGSVIVESHGHNVVLSPGRHVMITPHHQHEFAQLNAVETIAHRNLSSTIKNGHRAHTSEFSVLSALDSVKPLKAITASRHPNARKIAGRMLKTTAILLQIGGAGEQYQHYFKPRMTAMGK